MRIFLVGYMGSGKTTLGEKLAYLLKYQFIDLDKYIQEQEEEPLNRFLKRMERSISKLERVYLHRIIDSEDVVISSGGGTPCFFDNMDQMNEYGQTIYINLHPKALIARLLTSDETRPLLAGKTQKEMLDFVFQQLREREVFYKQAKKITSGYNLTARKLLEYCSQE